MIKFSEFDESNELLMDELSEAMARLVPSVFPPTIKMSEQNHTLGCCPVFDMEKKQLKRFRSIVDECMGTLYVKHKGENWKKDKLDEMAEPGLIYVWYESEQRISCFMSMKMTTEPDGKTLYLYEIHVKPEFQSSGVGTTLIGKFHEYGEYLNVESGKSKSSLGILLGSGATGLTVFSDNLKALKWYLKLGYSFSPYSPLDKCFRNGRVVKPSVYLLSRNL